jgi:hypothetical protein
MSLQLKRRLKKIAQIKKRHLLAVLAVVAVLFVALAFGAGSFRGDPGAKADAGPLDIRTDQTRYVVPPGTQEMRLLVTFENGTDRDLEIERSGCDEPAYVIEQADSYGWSDVGLSDCLATSLGTDALAAGEAREEQIRVVATDLADGLAPGRYRLGFRIEDPASDRALTDADLYSNPFEVVAE